jgi:hypothetical protein
MKKGPPKPSKRSRHYELMLLVAFGISKSGPATKDRLRLYSPDLPHVGWALMSRMKLIEEVDESEDPELILTARGRSYFGFQTDEDKRGIVQNITPGVLHVPSGIFDGKVLTHHVTRPGANDHQKFKSRGF